MASMHGHNETVQVLLSDPNIDIDIGHVTKGETPFSIASTSIHNFMFKRPNHHPHTYFKFC